MPPSGSTRSGSSGSRATRATTIEQIAEAAEVSPATFFRYFPTKEDVVLQDDFDIVTLAALEAQPPDLSPIAAFRGAAAAARAQLSAEDLARFAETTRLTLSVPEIRARALDELIRTTDVITAAIAARIGRGCGRLRHQEHGRRDHRRHHGGDDAVARRRDDGADVDEMFDRIDAGLAHLEAGLPL